MDNRNYGDKVINDKQINIKKEMAVPTSRTKITNFTIEHILNKAGPNKKISEQLNFPETQKYSTNCANDLSFKWLTCTRYHPPKLMRPLRSLPIRRAPGRLPRIPFSPLQLRTLERAFAEAPYLSSHQAGALARTLQLTDTRVKIWFQNRRARARREPNRNNTVSSTTPNISPVDRIMNTCTNDETYISIMNQTPDRTDRRYTMEIDN